MKCLVLVLWIGLGVSVAEAKGAVEKSSHLNAKPVELALSGFRRAKGIKAKVKKTVHQEAMGTDMASQGDFYLAKGKMRLDISEPEKTSLVYDGKAVWFESRLDDDHVSVTKFRANEMRRSNSVLAALFDRQDVLRQFQLKRVRAADNGGQAYFFEAKDKKKSDIQSLEIIVKAQDISRVAYVDQIENKVTLDFSALERGAQPSDRFKYKAPKGAEINEP